MRSLWLRMAGTFLVFLLVAGLSACGSSKGSDGGDVSYEGQDLVDESDANKACLACHASQSVLDDELDIDRDSLVDRSRLAELREIVVAIEWGELTEDAMTPEEEAELEELAELAAIEDRVNGLLVEEAVMGTHGKMACTQCHLDSDVEMNDWHPMIVANPTADGGDVCATCHGTELVENYKASIHFTLSGIANGVCKRLKPLTDVDPEEAQRQFDGYFADEAEGCMSCHATCGSCHVSSPLIQGSDPGGLMDKHRFVDVPESSETCMKCHWENGEMWEGSDVHATEVGLECTSCHTAIEEVHGRDIDDMEVGPLYYKGPATTETGPVEPSLSTVLQTSCEDCHNNEASHDNAVISSHTETLDCFACHTQPYFNCYGCHAIDGGIDGGEEYVKLGLTEKGNPESKLGLLTHIGSAFDMIDPDNPIPSNNADPDWKSAWAASSAMHLIARTPLVTDAAVKSGSTCDNCHTGEAEIFLKASELDTSDVPPGGADPIDDLQWVVPEDRLPGALD